jgi:hypothetical protein
VAGVEEDAIALADLGEALPLHHRPHVGRGDDAGTLRVFGDRQPLRAAVGGRVEQHAAAHEALLGDELHAEIAHADHAAAAAALVRLLAPAPVVHEVALRRSNADVARAVELRPDLADLGRDELVVVDERVLPERPAGRRARNRHRPAARAEGRDARVIELAERRDLALFHQPHRLHDHRRRGAVGRAHLVVGAPFGGSPALGERLVVDGLRGLLGAHERHADHAQEHETNCHRKHRPSCHLTPPTGWS